MFLCPCTHIYTYVCIRIFIHNMTAIFLSLRCNNTHDYESEVMCMAAGGRMDFLAQRPTTASKESKIELFSNLVETTRSAENVYTRFYMRVCRIRKVKQQALKCTCTITHAKAMAVHTSQVITLPKIFSFKGNYSSSNRESDTHKIEE